MSNLDSINDDLTGSRSPAAKFAEPGDIVKGKLIGASKQQEREYETSELVTWPDGSPKFEYLIEIETEDDGPQTIYARNQLWTTIRDAVQASDAGVLEAGGTLAVKFTALGEPSKKGFHPPKLYSAKWEPPALLADDF